jgi:hypothetical protein
VVVTQLTTAACITCTTPTHCHIIIHQLRLCTISIVLAMFLLHFLHHLPLRMSIQGLVVHMLEG